LEYYNNLVKFLKESYRGQIMVVLFGSRAKDTYNKFSDYDLLVIVRNENLMDKLKSIRRDSYSYSVDMKIYVLSEIKERVDNFDTILLDAFSGGKLIYDGLNKYNYIKEIVKGYINQKGLIKRSDGWFRKL